MEESNEIFRDVVTRSFVFFIIAHCNERVLYNLDQVFQRHVIMFSVDSIPFK